MPSKVYLEAPPHGDFRAMPALGGGFAMLKWISSFPGNPAEHGLPTVMGVVCLSDAETSEPLMLLDARAVTALRTGAVAAVAAARARAAGAASVGVIGCGLHGAWAARCLAAAGYGPGVCADPRPEAAEALAEELGWRAGERAEALACDVVCCVTPATSRSSTPATCARAAPEHARRRRPGQGRGDDRGGRALRAVLRRVGAGVARRRADRRRRGGRRHARPGHRPRRRARRRGARARRTPTPSRCSTRPASRSRTSRSRSPRSRRGAPAASRPSSSCSEAFGPFTPLIDRWPRSTR